LRKTLITFEKKQFEKENFFFFFGKHGLYLKNMLLEILYSVGGLPPSLSILSHNKVIFLFMTAASHP